MTDEYREAKEACLEAENRALSADERYDQAIDWQHARWHHSRRAICRGMVRPNLHRRMQRGRNA